MKVPAYKMKYVNLKIPQPNIGVGGTVGRRGAGHIHGAFLLL